MTTWALITGTAIVLALPLAWRIARRRWDPFEPMVLFAIAYGAMFVARPAAIMVHGESYFWGLDILPTMPRALVITLLGAVAFVTGYELHAGRWVAEALPAAPAVNARIAALTASGIAVLGLVALLMFLPLSNGVDSLRVLTGGRGGELARLLEDQSTYLWYGSLVFAPAALVLIALFLRDRRPLIGIAGLLVSALALVRVAPVGGRIVLLPLLGGLLVLVYVMREKRPGPLLLAGIASAALLGSYFIIHIRDPNDSLTVGTAAEDLRERPYVVFDPVLRSADAEMILALSAALSVIPDELPHRYGGATVGNLLARPVPREVWPGKPRPPGETVVATVWPDLYPNLNPAFSPLLAFYWDLGLAGVAIGMVLFGIGARALYEWFIRHRHMLSAQLVFAIGLWFVVIGARNDPVDTIVLAMFLVAPIVAIVALASSGAAARHLDSTHRDPATAANTTSGPRR